MKPELSFLFLLSLVVFGAITVTNAGGGAAGAGGGGGLRLNFYRFTRCPQAERLVRDITRSKVQNDPTLAAKLLRVHYHDCFVKVRLPFTDLHAMHTCPAALIYSILILLRRQNLELNS